RQAVEGGRGGVDDDHLVAGSVEAVGEDRADPATPDDHGFHWFSSWIGSRTTQTAQGAFFRTYGIVRPIAKSPPNLVRYARPTTSRSASRSSASSTSAAPTSRAWSSTDSSVTPAASAVPSARSSTCWISSERPATSTSSGIDQSTSTTWTPISSALLAFASSATRRMSRMPFGCPDSATTARRNEGAAASGTAGTLHPVATDGCRACDDRPDQDDGGASGASAGGVRSKSVGSSRR